ncbi:MAG: DNA topoisomerase IV subunit B [Muribaculaceae bacterium]|nr:DNA topoisomerase IV subunit B [Muribaculaceae bacterium]
MADIFDDSTQTAAPELNGSDYNRLITLDWREHIRQRPGMYIGKLGDGSQNDDGIYVIFKEVMDNAIDEHNQGFGKLIEVEISETEVSVRDYGRGIPLGSVIDAASKMNTGGKYNTENYKMSVGLNGVGIKATNALSSFFFIQSTRDGKSESASFEAGILKETSGIVDSSEQNGTLVQFIPDNSIFHGFKFNEEYIETMIKNYSYLNTGLTITLNGRKFHSRNGLCDLLRDYMTTDPLYPVIHLEGQDIEAVITHTSQYGEEYYSFVNGQHTTQGGTHQSAFREAVSRTIKEFFGRNFEYSDIRNGMVAAISIRIQEPVFESQTKTKLGSSNITKDANSPTVYKFINDFIKKELDNYLHREPNTSEVLLKKIIESEKDRKAMAGVTKKARENAKKIQLHNRKLRDCRVHLNDTKGDKRELSSIFITEGDSASGSITKTRDVETQAVFSLRGKPLNSFGKTQKIVYDNEEFNLLQAALNIEEGIEGLRYNKIIIATDADVDGMHIRLLMITFLLRFFPDVIKKGHVYILQTPLFRVRNKKEAKRRSRKGKAAASPVETFYCYTDEERVNAIKKLGENAEITRFKGLGEISAEEFKEFIGPNMRLDRVSLRKDDAVQDMLEFYMGKNTMERQLFIIDNLVTEDDTEINKI